MTFVKYICVDDQPREIIDPMLDLLVRNECSLSFFRMHPKDLDQQYALIDSSARADKNFGLLLDLRLDEEYDDDGSKVFYRGPTLAQELRSRMADGELKSFPVVLWSMNDKIASSYFPDSTSHDLFDLVCVKDDVDPSGRSSELAMRLVSLAEGYALLNSSLNRNKLSGKIEMILDLKGSDREALDPRLVTCFSDVSVCFAARSVMSLLKSDGVLIGEEIVAARLGIDMNASESDWERLKNALSDCRYSGVFSSGWERWWSHKIDLFFRDKSGLNGSWRRYGAEERVNALNTAFGISLVNATPVESSYSDKFDTVCFASRRPIDSLDGLKIFSNNKAPWSDDRYISLRSALNRVAKNTWKLDPMELERYMYLKDEAKRGKI